MFNLNLVFGLILLSAFAPIHTEFHNITDATKSLSEGGPIVQEDKTHLSREHVNNEESIPPPPIILNKTEPVNETIKILPDKSAGTIKPVTEKSEIDLGVPKKNDEKQSVGKKGVSFSDMNTTSDALDVPDMKENVPVNISKASNVTTTKAPVPKKPLITEHDDYVASNDDSVKSDPNPKIASNIDTILEKKSQRADYVIPIVAVILSVPLVAIIISVLYKRGTDWWQHRNYRRMDFLIEGMYNN